MSLGKENDKLDYFNLIPFPRVLGSDISVRPTDLRRSKEYVVFYHTLVWGFLTGKEDTCQQPKLNVFSGFVPVVCLIFLNTKIYLAMKKLKSNLSDNKKQLNSNSKGFDF